MKNKILFSYMLLQFFLYMMQHNIYAAKQVESADNLHVRKGYTESGSGQIREYLFNNTNGNAGFFTTFPSEKIEKEIPDDILSKWKIEYNVYSSIDNAEWAIVELLESTNLWMYNMIDSMLDNGKIGNNCWHNLKTGVIIFHRNNVYINIYPKEFMSSTEYANAGWLARKIDSLIVDMEMVYNPELVPTPIIESVEIKSALPRTWADNVKVKINATDPNATQLYYRQYADGLASISQTGELKLFLSKNLNATEDSTKAKIMIWVWNENHYVTLVEQEIPF